MIGDKSKNSVDKSKVFSALLSYLKVSLPALKMIQGYLLNRKQKTKTESSYNTWENIIPGVLQGAILEPLIKRILMWLIFYFIVVALTMQIRQKIMCLETIRHS